MSATGRGAERIGSDNYPTPSWVTRRLIEALEQSYDYFAQLEGVGGITVLEPCVGEGAIVKAWHSSRPLDVIWANDIRNTGYCLFNNDYLNWKLPGPVDLIVTNPPFSLAEEITQKALRDTNRFVAMLVRQGFVGHGRAEWMRGNMPDSFELPDRPSFVSKAVCHHTVITSPAEYVTESVPCGWSQLVQHGTKIDRCPSCGGGDVRVAAATDAADYCWLVWTPVRNREFGLRRILPSTPLAERKLG